MIVFAFLIAVFSISSAWAQNWGPGYIVGTQQVQSTAKTPATTVLSAPSGKKDIAWYVNQNQWFTKRCQMGRYTNHKCWSCPLFVSMFNTASMLTSSSFKKFRESLRALVVLGTAIWLAIYLLKKLPEFSGLDWRKMAEETSSQIFRTLLVVILLSSDFSVVRSLTLDPVFDTGMKITQYFSGNYSCKSENTGAKNLVGSDLSTGMGAGLVCSVQNVEMEALGMVDLGWQAVCLSVDKNVKGDSLINLHFAFSGFAYVCLGLIFVIGCPFLLIDCVVNMLFAGALIPFGIACYAFNVTKKHLTTVFNTFLKAVFNFLFMSIVLFIMFKCVEVVIWGGLYTPDAKGLDNMMNVMGVSTMNFFKVGFIFMLGWSALSGINDFAGEWQLEGGGSIGVGKGMGSGLGISAMAVTQSANLTAIKASGKIAKGGFKAARNVRRIVRGNKLARQAAAAGGAVTSIKTYGKFRSFFRGGRGDTIMKKETYVNGVLLTQKIRVDSNGNQTVISSKSEIFDKALRKELQKPAGRMDTSVIGKFIANAGNNKDVAAQAVMLQLFQDRLNKGTTGIDITKSAKGASFSTFIDQNGREHFMMVQKTKKGTTYMDMAIGDGVVYTGLEQRDSKGDIQCKYETNGIATRVERMYNGRLNVSNGISSEFQGEVYSDGSHSKKFRDDQLRFGLEGHNIDYSKGSNRRNYAAFN